MKIKTVRPEILTKNVGSDGEEYEINSSSSRSEAVNSDKSSLSLSDNNFVSNLGKKRPSIESYQFIQSGSRRNSMQDEAGEGSRRRNSIGLKSHLSYFPKLALEVENIDTENNKKASIDQAKRLLALASIRPSKTFHKSMTEQEIEVLKKYYEIIKPKVSLNQNQNDLDNYKIDNSPPLVYNTAKVNASSLESVRSFLSTYQKDLESGFYKLDYDATNDPKCFVLKNKLDESIVKFPEELNDTFFALAASTTDRDRQSLGEANLFRIVNWNDTNCISL